mgnify:FL=1
MNNAYEGWASIDYAILTFSIVAMKTNDVNKMCRLHRYMIAICNHRKLN